MSGFVGGRGSGKSWAGAYRMFRVARPGGRYMVVAPTYKVLADCTMESFWQVDKELGFVSHYDKTNRVATLGNGARVLFRSGDDPDSLRGPNLWGAWLDEASYMHKDVFHVIVGCLREGGSVGPLWATFTPNGCSHWTYEVFGPGTRSGAVLFRASSRDNPFNPPEFADFLALQYAPLRQRQEIGGEFVTIEGAEWPPEYLSEDMFYREMPKSLPVRFWVQSLDPSVGKDAKEGDLAALLRVAVDNELNLWVDDAWLDVKPIDQVEDMGVAFLRLEPSPVGFIIETNNFQELVAANIARKAPAAPIYPHISTENKEVRVRMALTPLLAQGRIHLRDIPANRRGFAQMQEFPLPKSHDDYPDALALATVLINKLLRGPAATQPTRLRG